MRGNGTNPASAAGLKLEAIATARSQLRMLAEARNLSDAEFERSVISITTFLVNRVRKIEELY